MSMSAVMSNSETLQKKILVVLIGKILLFPLCTLRSEN